MLQSRRNLLRAKRHSLCVTALALFTTSAGAQTSAPPAQVDAPAAVAPGEIQARIDKVVADSANEPRFKGLSEAQRRDRIEFVAGNVIFATLHEVGHMLIAEMGLPVLGREEDAADAFAALTGLRLGGSFSDTTLTDSALGWFMSDRRNQAEKITTVFYDEHGLDKQRAYNIVCLMVGGKPDKFGKLAEMTGMPEDRQLSCQGDFSNASWSWNTVLDPHLRKKDQPKTTIEAVYLPTEKNAIYERGFRSIRLLETLSEHLSDRFVWRRPVRLQMRDCDEPSARWDLEQRRIYVCYELAADFAELYRDYGEQIVNASSARKSKR
jgi:Putative metallopeptidase